MTNMNRRDFLTSCTSLVAAVVASALLPGYARAPRPWFWVEIHELGPNPTGPVFTGEIERRQIVAYDGTTKTATFSPPITLDADKWYQIGITKMIWRRDMALSVTPIRRVER